MVVARGVCVGFECDGMLTVTVMMKVTAMVWKWWPTASDLNAVSRIDGLLRTSRQGRGVWCWFEESMVGKCENDDKGVRQRPDVDVRRPLQFFFTHLKNCIFHCFWTHYSSVGHVGGATQSPYLYFRAQCRFSNC